MTFGLWDWQDDDAVRLTVEGKRELAECWEGFDLLEAAALLELGRPTDAIVVLDRLASDLQGANVQILVMLYRAAAALQKRDLDAMAGHVAEARALLESGAEVNPDNSWFVLELEIKCMIARGEVAQAAALSQESPQAPLLGSAEAIRIAIVMAEAWARTGQWGASRCYADRALTAARTRGMVRYAAEAALWAGEACQQAGDREDQERYASGLEMLIPQLRSRDLDQRAKDLGAAIP